MYLALFFMMKKVYTIALLHLYLLSVVGLSMNVHSCGGETSHEIFGLSFSEQCCCDHENHEHSADCCHDENVLVKAIDNDKIHSKTIILTENSNFVFTGLLYTETKVNLPLAAAFQTPAEADHPPNSTIPIYLSNRVFLI